MSDRTFIQLGVYPEDRAAIARIRTRVLIANDAAAIRHAIRRFAEALDGDEPVLASPGVAKAKAHGAFAADAARLLAILPDEPARVVANLAGCSATTVRTVRRGEARLTGALLALVEGLEREAGK